MSSLASSQSQPLRGVSGANALGANTPAQGRRVSTLVRAGKAPEEHVPSEAKSDDAPELEDTIANKVMSGVAAASIIANVAIAPVALAARRNARRADPKQKPTTTPTDSTRRRRAR